MARESRAVLAEPLPGGGTSFRLPDRAGLGLPGIGLLRWFLTPFGLAFFAVGAYLLLTEAGLGRLMGLPFALVGLLVALLGLAIGSSHAIVRVLDGRIERVERLGLLGFQRSVARERVGRLEIVEMPVRVNGRRVRGVGHLVFRGADASTRLMAAGFYYPDAVLQDLASLLAEELELEASGGVVAVAASDERRPDVPAAAAPPAGSGIVIERNAAGLMITVPKPGWKGLPRLLVIFGGVFVLFPVAIGTAIVMTDPESLWMMIAFISLFVVAGSLIVGWGIVMAGRHALLAIVQGSFVVRRIRPFFGVKVYEWPAGTVRDIRVQDSSTSVNDRPLRQLSIRGAGQDLALLTGQKEAELQWLAGTLCEGLGIGSAESAAAE
ncbi:MAG: hypothetical protein NXI31_03630 [bacterium]|nr:hypothetical protein [bacterium]